jgi:hypothetical protein
MHFPKSVARKPHARSHDASSQISTLFASVTSSSRTNTPSISQPTSLIPLAESAMLGPILMLVTLVRSVTSPFAKAASDSKSLMQQTTQLPSIVLVLPRNFCRRSVRVWRSRERWGIERRRLATGRLGRCWDLKKNMTGRNISSEFKWQKCNIR